MFREVSGDIEWGNEVLKEKRKEESVQPNQTSILKPLFSPPPATLFFFKIQSTMMKFFM